MIVFSIYGYGLDDNITHRENEKRRERMREREKLALIKEDWVMSF